MPRSTVLRVPPTLLDVHVRCRRSDSFCSASSPPIWLASQPSPMRRHARSSGAARSRRACAAAACSGSPAGHAAAGLVRQRDHAVHVRIVRQRVVLGERVALETSAIGARDVAAAVHRGQDADVVARRDASVRRGGCPGRSRAARSCRSAWRARRRRGPCANSPMLEVVHVDVLAGRDRLRREADDLAVAMHRLARGDAAGSRSCGPAGSVDGRDLPRPSRARHDHAASR